MDSAVVARKQRVTCSHARRLDEEQQADTAMHEKVRAAVTAKGFARSHIVVLEALFKLRQVCCDPRLVKIS